MIKEFFSNNKKYILATTAILTIAVVVVLFVVIAFDKKDISDDFESDAPISDTVFDEDENDPQHTSTKDESGQIVDSDDLPVVEERTNGIDVSKWQGAIDWKKVKESGIEFAFIRVGYRGENGIIYEDEFARYNLQYAHENGILIGVYFFSTAISEQESVDEAEWVLDYIKGYNISYPVVYDCEGYKTNTSRMYYLTAKMRSDIALAFLSKVADAGYDTMLYGGRNDLAIPFYWDTERIAKEHKIWVAQYPDITYPEIEYPDYEGRIDAWQYTDKGSVNGIIGDVDLVVCYFKDKLKDPKNEKNDEEKVPEHLFDEYDNYKRVDEQVTAKELTNLRSGPSTNFELVGSITNGEFVKRIGIGNKGWSMLEYNGMTVYAVTSYLTTEINTEQTDDQVLDMVFEKYNDKVTAKINVNLRTLPSTEEGEIVASLENGDFIERVAKSEKGWSRLIYKGQTVYAVSSYLTTQLVVETDPAEDVTYKFTPVSDTVTAKIETNLRNMPTTEGSEVVYTLKNGEFVKRVAVNNITGWSQLEYEGMTVYALTLYLTNQE